MPTLSSLYAQLSPHLPGATQPVLLQALWLTHREFCRETGVWQQTLQDQDVTLNQVEYELEPEFDDDTAQGTVGGIVFVRLYGVTPTANKRNSYRELKPPGDYWINDAGYLELYDYPTATVTQGMSVRIIVHPVDAVDYIDSVLLAQYSNAILAGVLQYLMLQPKKPYSNAQLGAFWRGEYEQHKNRARFDLLRGGNTSGEVTIKIPRF